MATNTRASVPAQDFDSAQPHPFWQSLRETCPVSAATDNRPGARPLYYVSTWPEVHAVLRDPETFSSAIYAEATTQYMGPNILAMDGQQHKSWRGLVANAFRTSQLARWEATLMVPAINRLCDAIAGRGHAELIDEVISRFPVNIICGMCGVPEQDNLRFLQWAKDIHRGLLHPEVGMAAAEAMRAYLEPLVEARRIRPTDDVISDIVHAEFDGQRLNDEEIYGFLRLLLPAGSESTFRGISNMMLAILTTPGLYARVLADRSILPALVEETVRWDVPNSMVTRMATRDTELAGCPIPAGARLMVLTNSANRDETQFSDAARFDPDRRAPRHVGFGYGPHQCLGQPLARLELRVATDVILTRLPNLRLDPSRPTPAIQGASFRSPAALHVLFDPA
ncbi:MAG: cytochrome P450 [Sphingomonadales bacterium]|nr:cytochrome P450 [Sphingomonadales bacterium]